MKQLTRLLLVGLVFVMAPTARAQINEQDSLALVTLYNATDGPNWQDKTNWLTVPVAQWKGVTVTSDRVTSLSLTRNLLSGPIPVELGNLTNLTVLDLSFNRLTGPIPVELGNLTNLTVLRLGNRLTGAIPKELANLTKLTVLDLGSNQLTGIIPVEFASLTNLEELTFFDNQLTGAIPSELGNLTNLTGLALHVNQLSGAIPPELGNLTNLTGLALFRNQLSGTIPPELGNLINLVVLSLGNNQLSGAIPPELGNLSRLDELNLWFTQLSGAIPPELGNLASMQFLIISHNPLLTGAIPFSFINLTNLLTFQFDNTNLCIPPDPAFQAWLQSLSTVQSTGITCTATPTEKPDEVPYEFALEANYPNPFNPSTTIRYALPQRASVHLSVYDVQGRLVRVLIETEQPTGWHEVIFEANMLPSGVYFYRLEAEAFRDIQAMLLVR